MTARRGATRQELEEEVEGLTKDLAFTLDFLEESTEQRNELRRKLIITQTIIAILSIALYVCLAILIS